MQKNYFPEKSFFHFSFLKDFKVNGVYFNTLQRYLERYSFIRNEHYHDFYSVILMEKGDGTIRITNDKYPVYPQTLYLIAPNQTHDFKNLWVTEGLVFFFCQDFYVEEFSYIRLLDLFSCALKVKGNSYNQYLNLSDDEYGQVKELFTSIGNEYERCNRDNNSAFIIRSLLNILMLRLLELYKQRSRNIVQIESTLIHNLSRLLDSHFITEHHAGFYLDSLNVTEKHLNELCHNYFNCSLKKILTDRLMQEARKQLLTTELTISELSFKLNFHDNSYFNKVFKKNTGLTPKRFRDIHRKLLP
jgi:AraC family transcriptional activator of pobA